MNTTHYETITIGKTIDFKIDGVVDELRELIISRVAEEMDFQADLDRCWDLIPIANQKALIATIMEYTTHAINAEFEMLQQGELDVGKEDY